jgi:hypothetical protein
MFMIEPVESKAMQMLLAGEHPTLELLREQFKHAQIKSRDFTGVGFFTEFEIGGGGPKVKPPKRYIISDVCADVDGLEFGCGFILFIADGLISTLECHLWGDDALPDSARYTRFYYFHQPEPPGIKETKNRDMDFVSKMLGI